MTEVPYFSQWESRTLIDRFLSRELRSEDDPLWRDSGAQSPEEYAQWCPHICGIACLKMLLAYRTERVFPLLELVRDAVAFSVYRPEIGGSGKRLLYRPFVSWLGERFQIQASVVEHTESSFLDARLREGNMLMASVHPGIRHHDLEPPARGGHLVLVLGVDGETGDWVFHNPSGFERKTQEYVSMPRTNFDRYFANRGILIAPGLS